VQLTYYASVVAGAVVVQILSKLLGSIIYQATRLLRWLMKRCCFCLCYRIEATPYGMRRMVCCCRPASYHTQVRHS
jgi:hypothetical protein